MSVWPQPAGERAPPKGPRTVTDRGFAFAVLYFFGVAKLLRTDLYSAAGCGPTQR